MRITHTRRPGRFKQFHDEEELFPVDISIATYCAPCMSGDDEYTSWYQIPDGHVPLLEDDDGVCCNCGRHTDGSMVPGEAGQERWIRHFQIAVYELDRAYGGPEEGGWWYDTGERVRVFKRVFKGKNAAYAMRNRIDAALERHRPKWVRSLGSVTYHGGHLSARVYPAGQCPEHTPESRPHYS